MDLIESHEDVADDVSPCNQLGLFLVADRAEGRKALEETKGSAGTLEGLQVLGDGGEEEFIDLIRGTKKVVDKLFLLDKTLFITLESPFQEAQEARVFFLSKVLVGLRKERGEVCQRAGEIMGGNELQQLAGLFATKFVGSQQSLEVFESVLVELFELIIENLHETEKDLAGENMRNLVENPPGNLPPN